MNFKKTLSGFVVLISLIYSSPFLLAGEENPLLFNKEKSEDLTKNPDNTMFVVSTDDESVSESLNRIAGDIDKGFASKEQSYKSVNHTSSDPYHRGRSTENAQTGY